MLGPEGPLAAGHVLGVLISFLYFFITFQVFFKFFFVSLFSIYNFTRCRGQEGRGAVGHVFQAADRGSN